ncbi:hypothetical protein [Microbacterium sp. JB110]|uniref:hypothetical protein n=1 Tax=Microbacterium sp. JB110 TaxID=2024477 RepID=UPI00097EE6F4|nr:hypothetical protein [Microbacterium sp. JB110]RCS60744.1 hypothetical protein CIK77_08695 [Microbacterium sp. JB110]SJM43855.1 MNN4 protein [Frigoribacterium sp. JB110]
MSTQPASDTRSRDDIVRSRRRLRRWLLLGFSPVAIAGLVIVVKLLSMYAFAHQAVTSHVSGDPARTVAAAEGQTPLNWFEPYLAPYNVGVGLASYDRLPEARAEFERALPLVSGLKACPVHINLGLVVEMMADQARTDDPEAASTLYAEALEINLATPEECRSEKADEQSPDPERSNEETLDDQQERLQQKQQQNPQDDESQDGGGEEEEPSEQEQQEQQDKLDEIEEKLQNGDQERQDQGADGDEDGGGFGSDKPW